MGDAIAGWVLGSDLRFDFTDPMLGVRLDYRAAGFGSQQILPVIALLFTAPKDSTLMIEEPEISLHPQGQMDVGAMLADAVSLEQQVLVSTHSKVLIMGLRRLVADGKLKAKDIAIYEMEKTSNGSKATPLRVTAEGTIPGWVPSYAKAEDELWRDWFEHEEKTSRNAS
jgi:predicted ATPase